MWFSKNFSKENLIHSFFFYISIVEIKILRVGKLAQERKDNNMNKDLKNNVEIEQDEYDTAYTDPGNVNSNVNSNVFANVAMNQEGFEKIRESVKGILQEVTVTVEQANDETKERYGEGSIEHKAAEAFQEEIYRSISTLIREVNELKEATKEQNVLLMLAEKNRELQKQSQEQEKAKKNISKDFKDVVKGLQDKITQVKDITVDKLKSGLSHVKEAAEKTLENVRQFRVEKERDVLKAADRGIMKQKEIMLNYNRQMAKMHENVKNKLVEIRKGLDTKAKDFSVAKEAVKNLFRKEEKKVDIENMQEQTNLFSKLSSTLTEQIGSEEDAAHGYNEKAVDIEKEMSDIKDKWQMIGENLDRQEKDEEIDIEESELDKDDERYGNVLDAADQMLEEAENFDDLINDANKQADEINRQAQDRDIDQDIDKDYER